MGIEIRLVSEICDSFVDLCTHVSVLSLYNVIVFSQDPVLQGETTW
jgi:hypothetical protein